MVAKMNKAYPFVWKMLKENARTNKIPDTTDAILKLFPIN